MNLFDKLKSVIGRRKANDPFPEAQFSVKVTARRIVCTHPDGRVEELLWKDLRKFDVTTTGTGPLKTDVFWVLQSEKDSCLIPMGATGQEELLQQVIRLPGFDLAKMLEGIACKQNSIFICWQGDAAAGGEEEISR